MNSKLSPVSSADSPLASDLQNRDPILAWHERGFEPECALHVPQPLVVLPMACVPCQSSAEIPPFVLWAILLS